MQDIERIKIADCIAITARHFQMSEIMLTGTTREQRYARPRTIAMALAREVTNAPLANIGRAFGCRHHTTIITALQRMAGWRYARDELWACRLITVFESLKAQLETSSLAARADYLTHAVHRAQLENMAMDALSERAH